MPAAHVLVDESGSSIAGCGAGVLAAAGVALVFALMSASTLWSVILAVFVVLGLVAVVWALLEMRRWEPLELHFAEWPLQLGSNSPVRVVRRARQPVTDADYALEAELECTESATYTVGTDTRTDTDVVHRDTFHITGELRDRTFEANFVLPIPADRGAPTMDLGNNTIEWKFDIDVNELSRLMAIMAFTLEVAPVLDQQRRNIQDTIVGEAP